MRVSWFLLSAPALALVGAMPATAQPAREYRASGTEPFWGLTIGPRVMRLEEMGRPLVSVRTPRARQGIAGQTYLARGMTVSIVHRRCNDGMSDFTYPDTVTVRVGRRTLRGCGGTRRGSEASPIANTRWTLWSVNGREVAAREPLTVNFTADRIEGRICNGFGGTYNYDGRTLTAGPLMSTKMACQGPAGTAETAFHAIMARPVSASISRYGTLILSRGRDQIALRRAR